MFSLLVKMSALALAASASMTATKQTRLLREAATRRRLGKTDWGKKIEKCENLSNKLTDKIYTENPLLKCIVINVGAEGAETKNESPLWHDIVINVLAVILWGGIPYYLCMMSILRFFKQNRSWK